MRSPSRRAAPPPISNRRTRPRHLLLGALALVGLLLVALAALAVFRVSSESSEFVAERSAGLAARRDLVSESLRVLERAANDDVERALSAAAKPPGVAERGAIVAELRRRHPVIAQPFLLEGDAIVWPPLDSRDGSSSAMLDSGLGDTSDTRARLNRVYARVASGDDEGAIEAVATVLLARTTPLAVRAEMEFLRAAILMRREAPAGDVTQCFDRVIDAAPADDALSPGGARPWVLAARLRKASYLINRGAAREGIGQILELAESLLETESARSIASLSFYCEKALAILASPAVRPALENADRRRLDVLAVAARRLREELALRGELESWRDVLAIEGASENSVSRRATRRIEGGLEIVIWCPVVLREG